MINEIKKYIKDVPHAAFIVGIIVVAFAVLMILQGCNLASFVQVNVPAPVKTAVGIAPSDKVTLDNADIVWEDWLAYVNSNTKKFESAIEDANERYATIRNLTDMSIGIIGQETAGIPGGAILMSAISLVGGILLKRPGEDARVAKEKQDSYNKGLEVGSTINKT